MKTTTPIWESEEFAQDLRNRLEADTSIRPHVPRDHGDWTQLAAKVGIPSAQRPLFIRELKLVNLLPFADHSLVHTLLVFKHCQLPSLRRGWKKTNKKLLPYGVLFEILLQMALQGTSIFPQNPARLAHHVQSYMLSPPAKESPLAALVDLLVDVNTLTSRAGYNQLLAQDLETVIEGEYRRLAGMPESAYRAEYKIAAYRDYIKKQTGFLADWAHLKHHFPVDSYRDSKGIIRRQPQPERGCQPPAQPELHHTHERFAVAFNIFCWKWCLYGMKGDEPMVEKLTYTATPNGTQIFIPAYWSFDHTRDLDWKQVLNLHRARGIGRQGLKLSVNHAERIKQLKVVAEADREAKSKGLKGVARYSYVVRAGRLSPDIDQAQLRRMIKNGQELG